MSDPNSKLEKAIKSLTAQYDKLNKTVAELVSNEDSRNEYIAQLFIDVRKDMHDSFMFVYKQLQEIDDKRESGQNEARVFRRLMLGGIGILIILTVIFGLFILDKVYNGR